MQDGYGTVYYRDHSMAPTGVRIKDPCRFGFPEILTGESTQHFLHGPGIQ